MIKKSNGKTDWIAQIHYYLTIWLVEHTVCAVFGHKPSGRPGIQSCERCGKNIV